MADDRWCKMVVKSRWMDVSAGGSFEYVSWRDNPQWRLTVPREMEVTFQLSLPDSRLGATNATPPMGLVVVQSNPGADARRRKLRLAEGSETEIVFFAEPRLTRRLQTTVRLPATAEGQPYVLVPFLAAPGAESKFTLTVLSDDLNDDGVPELSLEPMLPNPPNREDWYVKRVEGTYTRCITPANQPGFSSNASLPFTLEKAGGGGEGRVYVCLETIGATTDMRGVEGMQSSPSYPSIGLALLPSTSAVSDQLPANAIVCDPVSADGVWLEATLPADAGGGLSSHVVVPFLGPGQPPSELQYALTVYSDCPLAEAATASAVAAVAGGLWECECVPVDQGGHGPTCPYRIVVERMAKMESQLDERLAFLDKMLTCVPVGQPFTGGVLPPSVAVSDGLGLSYG